MPQNMVLGGDLEFRARVKPLVKSFDAEWVSAARDLGTWPGAREAARLRIRHQGSRRARKLPGSPSARGHGHRTYTMSAEPALVSGAYALFEAARENATDLSAFSHPDRPQIDAQARAVLHVLGSAVTDAAAARERGMSLRTHRRRVAELLVAPGADSLRQAGMRAGELGLRRG